MIAVAIANTTSKMTSRGTSSRLRILQRLDRRVQIFDDAEKANVRGDDGHHAEREHASIRPEVCERALGHPARHIHHCEKRDDSTPLRTISDSIISPGAMADLFSLLAVLEHDPDDSQALESLAQAARSAQPAAREKRFAQARKVLGTRGRPDAVVALLDAELAASENVDRKADLQIERGLVLDGELLDVPAARAAFAAALELRPNDAMALEALDEIRVAEANWQKFAAKFVEEARARPIAASRRSSTSRPPRPTSGSRPPRQRPSSISRRRSRSSPRTARPRFTSRGCCAVPSAWTSSPTCSIHARIRRPPNDDKIAALIALSELACVHRIPRAPRKPCAACCSSTRRILARCGSRPMPRRVG